MKFYLFFESLLTHPEKCAILPDEKENPEFNMAISNDIIDLLRQEIQDGKYPINSRFPSEFELGERFSINKKTANKIVTLLVAEGFLKRGIGKQGTLVRQIEKYPKYHIAFLGSLKPPHYARIVDGLQAAAIRDHSMVSVFSPDQEFFGTVLQYLQSLQVDAIVANGYGLLPETGIPVIYVEDQNGPLIFPEFVTCDSFTAGYQLARSVLEKGHREIVFLYHIRNNPHRLEGMYRALEEYGITDGKSRTFTLMEHSLSECNLVLQRIRDKYPEFSAILACSNDNTYHMIRSLQSYSVDWMGKIALGGFGNIPGVSDIFPTVSVDQHPFQIGAEAYHQIVKKIKDPGSLVQKHVETEIIHTENIPLI